MLKFKKIYLALTAFLTCAVLSVSALAAPETAAEKPISENTEISTEIATEAPAEETSGETEEPDGTAGEGVAYTTAASAPGAVAEAVDTTPPPGELISPPYDPSSGELPPEGNGDAEMFSGFEKGYGSIDNIKDYWEINGYPEYISFICDQGVTSYDVATQTETVYHLWEVGIADISEEKKEEVRSLIASGQSLYFTDCTYNLEERRQIREEIQSAYPLVNAELSRSSEAIEVYLDGYDEAEWDKVEAEILAMYDNNSRLIRVIKMVPTDGIPETVPAVAIPEDVVTGSDNIGEIGAETAVASNIDVAPPAIGVPDGGAYPLDTAPETGLPEASAQGDYDIGGIPQTTAAAKEDGIVSNPEVSGAMSEIGGVAAMISAESQRSESDGLWIWICAVAATVVVITAAVILGKRHTAKSAGLADGGEVTVGGRITKGEVIKAVRESESVPDEGVFGEIMNKVKEKNK